MRKCGVCDNNLCLMLLKPRSIPYRASAITALKTFFYDKGPAAFPMTLHVAVPAGINPDSQQSEMRRISPEEMEFAFLEAIVDAIRRKAPKSELQAWRYHLLTVSYCYVLLDNEDDIAFAATRYRESLEQKFTSMQHTVYQKMMGVVYMIKRLAKTKGRLSSKQVEQLYQDKVGTANEHTDGKEALSSNFIDTAVTFYERVLSIASVSNMMRLADNDSKNPFNGSTKIQEIISKAGNKPHIEWCFLLIWDLHRAGRIPEGISYRNLKGTMPGAGGKGLVELLVYKFAIAKYFVEDWAVSLFPAPIIDVMKKAFTNPCSYRELVGFPQDTNIDHSWRCGWPDSAEELFVLLESIIYGTDHDMQLKGLLKNRKSAEEACGTTGLSEFFDSVKAKNSEEKMQQQDTPEVTAAGHGGEGSITTGSANVDSGSQDDTHAQHDTDENHMAVEIDPERMTEDITSKIAKYRMHCRRLVKAHVRIEVEPASEAQLITMLQSCALNGKTGDMLRCLPRRTHSCKLRTPARTNSHQQHVQSPTFTRLRSAFRLRLRPSCVCAPVAKTNNSDAMR